MNIYFYFLKLIFQTFWTQVFFYFVCVFFLTSISSFMPVMCSPSPQSELSKEGEHTNSVGLASIATFIKLRFDWSNHLCKAFQRMKGVVIYTISHPRDLITCVSHCVCLYICCASFLWNHELINTFVTSI